MQHNSQIVLFQSPPEPCSYLEHHISRNVYADPFRPPTMETYDLLIQKGFRRSGHHIYRPHCDACKKCISIRIITEEFTPKRAQKRAQKKNSDLTTHLSDSRYTEEYFALYEKYLNNRHPDCGMDKPTKADFERFLVTDWCDSIFCELRLEGELLCVAVTDITSTGLSAVYTFFDPDYPKRSLGTAAIMKQVELTRQMNLQYLYLGYWISGSQKMMYKSTFNPQEQYIGDRWVKTDPL